MKKQVKKCFNAVLPALMICAAPMASSVRSISRFRPPKAVVKKVVSNESVNDLKIRNDSLSVSDPFAVFGVSVKADDEKVSRNCADADIMQFLRKEGLLTGKTEKKV